MVNFKIKKVNYFLFLLRKDLSKLKIGSEVLIFVDDKYYPATVMQIDEFDRSVNACITQPRQTQYEPKPRRVDFRDIIQVISDDGPEEGYRIRFFNYLMTIYSIEIMSVPSRQKKI